MGTSAVPAADTCDTQGKDRVLKNDFAAITAVPDEAAGVAAGTGIFFCNVSAQNLTCSSNTALTSVCII